VWSDCRVRVSTFRHWLKDDFFKRINFCAEFLSERDILDAAAAENYHWRDRIWTPVQTLWAFLVQVLEPDCCCREAGAHILAEQAACGQQVTTSPDPSAY
jgi:hypothetical protein